MPSPDDRSYFQRRARAELAIASICEDNAAALAHLRLADEYERRVRAMAPQMPSAVAGSLRG